MKTRTDFVSNSSSSSFVLFGDVFELDFLEKELMNNEDTQLYADYLNEKDRHGSYSSMYFIGNTFSERKSKVIIICLIKDWLNKIIVHIHIDII